VRASRPMRAFENVFAVNRRCFLDTHTGAGQEGQAAHEATGVRDSSRERDVISFCFRGIFLHRGDCAERGSTTMRPTECRRLLPLVLCVLAAPSTADASRFKPPPLVDLSVSDSLAIQDSVLFQSNFANWLVKGHVLLGRYPGSDPRRSVPEDAQRLRVQGLRRAGVTTFVCLQAVRTISRTHVVPPSCEQLSAATSLLHAPP
jgi:hypothetical protein